MNSIYYYYPPYNAGSPPLQYNNDNGILLDSSNTVNNIDIDSPPPYSSIAENSENRMSNYDITKHTSN